MSRYVVLHGHLYQPPREDPWTGRVPVEPSAAPFPDWNVRITEECYRPNIAAHVLADDGTVTSERDNYRSISYNVGPTLAVWLEEHAPDVHDALVSADSASHNAMAHPFVHAILPLACERDRRTLVRWGITDFRHRFGRPPEGMWLPETAVDTPTLETLAAEGITFTILAEYQLEGIVDARRPAQVALPSGRSILVLPYDAALSGDIAYGGLLRDGVGLAHRITASHDEDDASIVCFATDFETFGHHHRFGEMALARAIAELEATEGVCVVSAAEAIQRVESRPATLREQSAWSCAHGVERWRSDCGCRIGPATPLGQAWRAPLRAALDWLGTVVSGAAGMTDALAEPWNARDDYGAVLTGEEGWDAWIGPRLVAGGDAERARTWLELQRHLLLSTSSCGWFFDDAAGHETVLILRHAARALQLMQSLGGENLESGLVERLRPMRSEDPRFADGEAIWRELVAVRG